MTENKIIPIIMSLIGILSTFSGFISLQSPYKEYFVIAGIILLSLGLIVYVNHNFGLRYILQNLSTLRKTGVLALYLKGDNSARLNDYWRNSKQIKIMAVSAINLIRHQRSEIIEALVKNCATIKILLADNNSNVVEQIEDITSTEHKNLIRLNIESAEKLIEEYCKEAKKKAGPNQIGRVYLAKYDTHYKIPITIFDDKYGIVTLTLPPKNSLHSLTFVIQDKHNGLLEHCKDHFDKIWEYTVRNGRVREFH